MNRFVAYLRSKNWTTHTFAALGAALAVVITKDEQVRDFILGALKTHPTLGTNLVLLAGIIAKYSHSSSPAGKVAAAQAVLASANAPDAAAVAAASTSPSINLSSKLPLLLLAALLLPVTLNGCGKPQKAPAWAVTAPERTIGDTIAGAQNAVVQYEARRKAGDAAALDPTITAVMSDVQKGLEIAQPAYRQWAAALKADPAAEEPANLAGAIAAIESALKKLPATLQPKK